MKRRIAFLLFVLALTAVLAATAFANTYYANDDGLYEFELEVEANGEYVLFAIKGEYDQTNYIEAFETFSDEDLIYFEQKTVGEDGKLSFGPFAPMGYYDATLFVTGTALDQPVIAGYISAQGVSNYAKLNILGVKSKYTVEGGYGNDFVAEIEVKVYDSFGYESFCSQAPTLSLTQAKKGVSLDEENGTVTISKTAEEQVFGIVAAIGETKSIKYVEVVRAEEIVTKVKIFDSPDATEPVSAAEVAGTAGSYPSVTFYAKSYNQFGEELQDTYSYFFDEKESSNTVKPTNAGSFTFMAISDSRSGAVSMVTVNVIKYEENSLALYNLIEKCKQELSLIGTEKFVCDESGKSIFAPYTWTTTAKKTALEASLATATTALSEYDGANDADLADAVTALQSAYDTYVSSFKVGIRKDVTSISFDEESYLYPVSTSWKDIEPTTEPRLSATTDKITYTSSDSSIVQVDEDGRVKAVGNGTAVITATTRGGLTATTRVTSYHKITRITLDKTEYTCEYGKEDVAADAIVNPTYYGDTLLWTLNDPELAELVVEKTTTGEMATIVPKKSGKTEIVVKAVNSGISKTAKLEVVMPDWETVASPVANVSGNIEKGTAVVLDCETENATVYYTLDGTTPSKTNGRIYTAPVVVLQDLTICAVAVKDEMFDSDVAVYEYNVLDTAVSVTNAVVKAGDNARVDVYFADFIDVKNANVEISYDAEVLTLAAIDFSEEIDILSGEGTQMGKLVIEVSLEEGQSFDGKALTLEFSAADDAQDGAYAVELAKTQIFDVNGLLRNVEIQNGEVLIRDYVLGDANDDGEIGLEDVLIVKQYSAGNVSAVKNILIVAADVNGDGSVDKNDSSLIAQYCLGLIDNFN